MLKIMLKNEATKVTKNSVLSKKKGISLTCNYQTGKTKQIFFMDYLLKEYYAGPDFDVCYIHNKSVGKKLWKNIGENILPANGSGNKVEALQKQKFLIPYIWKK